MSSRKSQSMQMGSSLPLRLLCIFGLVILFVHSTNSACTTIPISLSSLERCENGYCYYSTSTVLEIPVSDFSTACLEFVSPDGETDPIVANITLEHALYTFNSEYYYFTDDPKITGKGFCGCPGGTPATCDVCTAHVPAADVVLCSSGVHNSDDCFEVWLGQSGTWCYKTALEGDNRYKVLKFIPTADKNFLFRFQFDNITWGADYHGSPIVYDTEDTSFNVTIIADTTRPPITPNFIVFDTESPESFYYLDASDVNSLNSFESTKIGWFKPNNTQKTAASLGNDLNIRVHNCNSNSFDVHNPWFNIRTFLNDNRLSLASVLTPKALLLDDQYFRWSGSTNGLPIHQESSFLTHLHATGWLFGTNSGVPVPVGAWYRTDGEIFTVPRNFDAITITNTSRLCQQLGPQTTLQEAFTGRIFDATTWNASETFSLSSGSVTHDVTPTLYEQIYIVKYHGSIFFCQKYAEACTCRDWCSKQYHPTTGELINVCYNGMFRIEHLGGNSSTIHTSTLHVPAETGVVQVEIEFQNLQVKYVDTTVKPIINSLKQTNDQLILHAQSLSVAGSCYVTTTPTGVVLTQNIDLTMSDKEYKFDLVASMNGTLGVIIQCYKNNATKGVKVSYEPVSDNIPEESERTSDPEAASIWDSLNPSNWDDAVADLFGDPFDVFGNGFSFSWWHYIVIIVEFVVFVIVGVLFIKLLVWSYSFVKMRRYRKYEDDSDEEMNKPLIKMPNVRRRRGAN